MSEEAARAARLEDELRQACEGRGRQKKSSAFRKQKCECDGSERALPSAWAAGVYTQLQVVTPWEVVTP